MTTVPHDPKNRVAHESPGARLAQARMDLHRSFEEVAAKLHLSSRQIQALEQDDYTSLPGPTYVRGYLKSYALLLGLEPGPILDLHAQRTAKPATPDYSAIAPQKEITSRHHQVRFTTYLVAAIVLGLAFVWWQGRDTRAPNPPVTANEGEAPVSAPTDAAEATTGAKMPEAEPQAKAPEAAASHEAPAPVAPAPTSRPSVAATSVPAPAAAPAAARAPAATPALPAGPRAKLVLYADQDSWADIRDARQVRLLYETVPAGRVVTLEGIAPVSVFLGNAAGVRLEYNGKGVDVNQYKRGMMARFTLGEDEAAVLPVP